MRKGFKVLTLITLFAFILSLSAVGFAETEKDKINKGQLKKQEKLGEVIDKEQEKRQEKEQEKAEMQISKELMKRARKSDKEALKEMREVLKEEGRQGKEIIVKGNLAKFDVPPVVKYGRTLIPFRAISQGLGAEVTWDEETKTVTVVKGDIEVVLTLGSTIALVNGEEVEMDTKPELISNRTFVPIRFLGETLGARVDYDEETDIIVVEDDENDDFDEDEDELDNEEDDIDEDEDELDEDDDIDEDDIDEDEQDELDEDELDEDDDIDEDEEN